ncbi:MAG: hypothetical protein KDD33_07925 [Bdellovibrionales bacterium]|nr:hypothetical protein [Bdellovibrionales bacterium]
MEFNQRSLFIILVVLTVSLPNGALGQEELPFWRQKKGLFQSIRNERKVVVSVKEESVQGQQRFRMVGVGAVNAPLEFCVERVKDYEKLTSLSSAFKKVTHNPQKKQIYMVLEALGYQARLLLEYKWRKIDDKKQQMDWRVIWGPFKGMVGHYQFQDLSRGQTEVSLWSTFSAVKLPVPDFLLKFTLEVIAEKVAKKMRSFIEDNYRKQKRKDP